MDNLKHAPLVPAQTQGVKKDLFHTVLADNEEDAEELFVIAKNRLLDINNWKSYSTNASAIFQLTDSHGKEAKRKAHLGDYLKIDIPGPGPKTGDGYDWVKIEEIVYDDYPDEHIESLGMRVRPCPSPVSASGDAAHFFDENATSTFIIERRSRKLIAAYHGRNEVTNNETEKVADNIRNTIVGLHAKMGFSDAQWEGLIRGFIEYDAE